MFSMDDQRARRILYPSMHRTMGRFASFKGKRMVHFESLLERDFCFQLEFDPTVVRYLEQPATIQIRYWGKLRRYTPDLAVERKSGITIYEVKPYHRASRAEMQELFEAAAEELSLRGYRYSVVTERDIQREPLLHNIKLLNRYTNVQIVDSTVTQASHWLSQHGPTSIKEFAGIFGDQSSGLRLVYGMLARQLLVAPLHTEVISPDTVVSV